MPVKLSPLPGQESEELSEKDMIEPSHKTENDVIIENLELQTKYLKTIKNCIVFFVVITIIAGVIAFFSLVL